MVLIEAVQKFKFEISKSAFFKHNLLSLAHFVAVINSFVGGLQFDRTLMNRPLLQ